MVYLCAFLKNMVYGLSVFFTQGLSENVDVLDILALRFIISTVVLWLLKITGIVNIKIGLKDFLGKTQRTPYLKGLLITALFEPVLYMFFETLGISMTTGITAGVILSLAPISSCISEEIFLKEKSTFMQKVFLGVGIVGVLYIAVNTASAEGKDTFLGMAFIALAGITGSLFLTFSRKNSKVFSAMEITYVSSALGMFIFNLINVVRHIMMGNISGYFIPYLNVENMIGFVFLAVISTVVATGMNNYAMSKMQVSTMAAFGGISTLTTILAGVLFRHEKLYMFHILGMVLIIIRMVGVSYIQIKKSKESTKINN